MASLARAVLIGNLTRDPELRTAADTSVCSMRVAVNERRKVDGEWTEVAGYYDVEAWGKQGENAAQYLSKGSPVCVDGRLRWREWETQEGQKRQAVSITADSVVFLGSRNDERTGAESEPNEEMF